MNSLDRYLFRQAFTPFLIATVVVTAIVWVTQSLQRADIMVEHAQGLAVFARMTMLIIPSLLAVIIPFALFAGAIYAMQRMHSDSEIAVMFASGVSRLRIGAPLLVIAAMAALATLWVNLDLMPSSYRVLKEEIANIRADMTTAVLRSGEFTTMSNGFTIYVDETRPGGQFTGLLINDYRDRDAPVTYMAQRGVLRETAAGPVLRLFNGNVQQVSKDTGSVEIVRFKETVINVSNFTGKPGDLQLELTERYLSELFHPDMNRAWDRQNAGLLIAEGHNRLASPLYAFAYVLIAIYALIGGAYSRRGYSFRITAACAAAGALRVVGFVVQGLTAHIGAFWLQYAVPLGAIVVIIILLSGLHHPVPREGSADK